MSVSARGMFDFPLQVLLLQTNGEENSAQGEAAEMTAGVWPWIRHCILKYETGGGIRTTHHGLSSSHERWLRQSDILMTTTAPSRYLC